MSSRRDLRVTGNKQAGQGRASRPREGKQQQLGWDVREREQPMTHAGGDPSFGDKDLALRVEGQLVEGMESRALALEDERPRAEAGGDRCEGTLLELIRVADDLTHLCGARPRSGGRWVSRQGGCRVQARRVQGAGKEGTGCRQGGGFMDGASVRGRRIESG